MPEFRFGHLFVKNGSKTRYGTEKIQGNSPISRHLPDRPIFVNWIKNISRHEKQFERLQMLIAYCSAVLTWLVFGLFVLAHNSFYDKPSGDRHLSNFLVWLMTKESGNEHTLNTGTLTHKQ